MERQFERVNFDDINDDEFLGVEEEQRPGAPAVSIPEIPPGGRTAADMEHTLELGEDAGKRLMDLAKKIREGFDPTLQPKDK